MLCAARKRRLGQKFKKYVCHALVQTAELSVQPCTNQIGWSFESSSFSQWGMNLASKFLDPISDPLWPCKSQTHAQTLHTKLQNAPTISDRYYACMR